MLELGGLVGCRLKVCRKLEGKEEQGGPWVSPASERKTGTSSILPFKGPEARSVYCIGTPFTTVSDRKWRKWCCMQVQQGPAWTLNTPSHHYLIFGRLTLVRPSITGPLASSLLGTFQPTSHLLPPSEYQESLSGVGDHEGWQGLHGGDIS